MASTVALYTGLSGLNGHARKLDVIGNNIANVNTTAYKSSRLVFSDQLSQTIRSATPPGDATGGTNRSQIGLGVSIAATQRDMRVGTIGATGNPRDMAIDGSGFFIVERSGEQFFTRAGNFQSDANYDLVTPTGDKLLGFPADENFELQVGGALAPINIPVGALTIAEATSLVRVTGNLNASGAVSAGGSVHRLGGTDTLGFTLAADAAVLPVPPDLIALDSLLSDIEDPQLPGTGTRLFGLGQTLQIDGVTRGGITQPTRNLVVEAATTVQDMLDFFSQALGIADTQVPNPDGNTPGVSIDPGTGVVTVVGNIGTINDLDLRTNSIRLLDENGAFLRFPLDASSLADASGESVRTSVVVYDSLGTPLELDVGFVLEGTPTGGATWRYFIESEDDTDPSTAVASGLLNFDTAGRLRTTDPIEVSIDRAGTGAETPLIFNMSFAGEQETLTSLTDTNSAIASTFRDGAPIGTLEEFAVARDGTILGAFSNTLIKPLGRLAVATFTNPEGLSSQDSNLYTTSANSGEPLVTVPGQLGTGGIVGGSLELSNVDLGQEFIEMILTSTGYTASSRVIQTTDELMQQLLTLVG